MRRSAVFTLIGLFFLSLLICPQHLCATPFYQGKVITIVVGYGPGGGYDRMARILAKHLPKYIPGRPTILVQNMPGAAGLLVANYLYNVAKPDGRIIGTFNRGLVFAQLAKTVGVKFDLTKFAWIGSAAVESVVLVLRTDLPYKTLKDVAQAKSQIMLGSGGPGDTTELFAFFLKEFLGYNFKDIIYPSSADSYLAMERKEIDGRAASYSSAKPFIDRGLVVPLVRCRVAEAGIEKLPVDEDLVKGVKEKTLMAMRSVPDGMGRPYVAPPGTPEAAMKVLRDAFAQVAKDPGAQEDARRSMMAVTYVSEQEVQKSLKYLLNQPPEIIQEFGKYIKF